jgi:hypothetical protein
MEARNNIKKMVAIAPSIGGVRPYLKIEFGMTDVDSPEVRRLNDLMAARPPGAKGSVMLYDYHKAYGQLHLWVGQSLSNSLDAADRWSRVQNYGILMIDDDPNVPSRGASIGLPAAAGIYAAAFDLDFDLVIGTGSVSWQEEEGDIKISIGLSEGDYQKKLECIKKALVQDRPDSSKCLIILPNMDEEKKQHCVDYLKCNALDRVAIFVDSGRDICHAFAKLEAAIKHPAPSESERAQNGTYPEDEEGPDEGDGGGDGPLDPPDNWDPPPVRPTFRLGRKQIVGAGILAAIIFISGVIFWYFTTYCAVCPALVSGSIAGGRMTEIISLGDLRKILNDESLVREFNELGAESTCMGQDEGMHHMPSRSWDLNEEGLARPDGAPVPCLSWDQADFYRKHLSIRSGHPYILVPFAAWPKYALLRKGGVRHMKEWLAAPPDNHEALQYYGYVSSEQTAEIEGTRLSTRSPDIYFRLILTETEDRP